MHRALARFVPQLGRVAASRLKLFLGGPPGHGKNTDAMLRAGRDERRGGRDVVVGIVATDRHPETEALVAGLEVIPARRVENGTSPDMDLDAIRRRLPQLVVVDGLAHANAPGSAHARRFQEVEALLDRGIDVYATADVQELEGLGDVIAQITGARVRETIPDRVVERADEIEWVGLSPQALLDRVCETNVYLSEPAERAIRKYVARGKPSADILPAPGHASDSVGSAAATVPDGARRRPAARPSGRRTATVTAYAVAAVLVSAAALGAAGVMAVLPLRDPGMFFLAAVLLSAVVGGLAPSVFASIASVVVYDFFFTEPLYSLRMTDPQDYLSLGAFLVVAVLTSHLTGRVRDQAEAARRREARTAALYAFGRALAGATTTDQLCRAIVAHVARAFATRAAILLPDPDRLMPRALHPPDTQLPSGETEPAAWAWKHDEEAGHDTAMFPDRDWLHVPLHTMRGAAGVLAVEARRGGGDFSPDQRGLLRALAGQAALAIDRSRVDLVETIIESIDDGLVVLDPDGIVIHVNDVASAILRCARTDALGRPFDALVTRHPHYVRVRAAVGDFLSRPEREPETLELASFHRGREHVYVLRPTRFGDPDAAPVGVVLVFQDVTRLREHEARREQLIATLSHELRTPLTSLRLGVDLLDRTIRATGGRPAELNAAVRRDVERLEDVAQRLLEVSRWRAMAIGVERRPVDLGSVLARLSEVFALQAAERGVSLATSASPDGATFMGDATKLGWALSNLVTNGLRYTPRGGRISVDASAVDGVVRIVVEDTGAGIPPHQRERIFDRYVQGGETTVGATGLGLAIVRDIVEAHGGRVHLESETGCGSRFILELPRG